MRNVKPALKATKDLLEVAQHWPFGGTSIPPPAGVYMRIVRTHVLGLQEKPPEGIC